MLERLTAFNCTLAHTCRDKLLVAVYSDCCTNIESTRASRAVDFSDCCRSYGGRGSLHFELVLLLLRAEHARSSGEVELISSVLEKRSKMPSHIGTRNLEYRFHRRDNASNSVPLQLELTGPDQITTSSYASQNPQCARMHTYVFVRPSNYTFSHGNACVRPTRARHREAICCRELKAHSSSLVDW